MHKGEPVDTKKRTVSLVLGSGGARGYTHIGVIEELEQQGYEITSISGASMGALIGGLYASGNLQTYKTWILGLDLIDVAKLLDLSFSRTGIIQGEKVFAVMEEMIGNQLIESLPIPFTAVATDLIKQQEVWFQRGSLIDAIRASIAIPTIFTPKRIGNNHFIDGGVLDPLPIAPLTADNSDFTIAVDLCAAPTQSTPLVKTPVTEQKKANRIEALFWEMQHKITSLLDEKKEQPLDGMGMLGIMGHTIDIMQNAIKECKMAGYKADITIPIPNNACGFYEFNRAYEMIELGRILTRKELEAHQLLHR